MSSSYIIILVLLFLVIIPWIMRRKRAAAISHIMNKKHNGEYSEMRELAKQFIGKECIIYTVAADSAVKGTVREVGESGLILERADGVEAVNLEFVTRIREWPRNAKGKKKQIFE